MSIRRTLESLKPEQRVEATNQLLQTLLQYANNTPEESVEGRLEQLLAVLPSTSPIPDRPAIPLNSSDLLVNARGEHRIGTELIKELKSADQVDLLCSFLKWSGFNVLQDALRQFAARGGRLRVITTCYLGATDVKVLEALSELGQVKVSYDSPRTRLHAKAWLFHRDTGYSTAYIGSSNMSSAALQDGLEWNVRISRAENPRILTKFQGAFEAYWQDGEFENYTPGQDKEKFLKASRAEASGETASLPFTLDVQPYPFQLEILERLETERQVHARWRNLVVAATGTGKTVMAGLDYRRVFGGRARLLFVAHREEILGQSLSTFRQILKDGSFGDLWTGSNANPDQNDHLFASVQKLANVDLSTIDPTHFDVLIVDEFHHAAAPTYTRLLQHFQPRLLLGLTATPERADGESILDWFDGVSAVELRLWDALERGLLCPFQYFGVHDTTDLGDVAFRRGRYDPSQLENVYDGDDARVRLILAQLHKHVDDPSRMRALGFCVGVGHAKFMARRFQEAGYPACAVLGETSDDERRKAVRDLREGRLQAIFTVDVFNEGVDLPEVDTLLFLRPTESATVFLQQLGRGLRRSPGKECVTVLDFIGTARQEFRFDVAYRALLGGTRRELQAQVEAGFPFLPSGCSMQLDRIATKIVVENLRGSIKRARAFLRQELRAVGPQASLSSFLNRSGTELGELYSGNKPGWVHLRRQVGFDGPAETEREKGLLAAVARLLHSDSPRHLDYLQALLTRETPPGYLPAEQQRQAAMLHFSLWSKDQATTPVPEMLEKLWSEPGALQELRALLPLLRERIDHQALPLEEHPDVPLEVHCHYSLAEILAGFGVMTPERPHIIREGVKYHEASGCDLFFITIRKNERDYSPSTLYRDYAVSPQLFHWESQSTTRSESKTGLRYQSHTGRTHALLFVRETAKDDRGYTSPYLFLGPAYYVTHEGERPMAITWRLRWPIPLQFYRGMRLAA